MPLKVVEKSEWLKSSILPLKQPNFRANNIIFVIDEIAPGISAQSRLFFTKEHTTDTTDKEPIPKLLVCRRGFRNGACGCQPHSSLRPYGCVVDGIFQATPLCIGFAVNIVGSHQFVDHYCSSTWCRQHYLRATRIG